MPEEAWKQALRRLHGEGEHWRVVFLLVRSRLSFAAVLVVCKPGEADAQVLHAYGPVLLVMRTQPKRLMSKCGAPYKEDVNALARAARLVLSGGLIGGGGEAMG